MKFTRIVEETVSGTSVEEYRIRMNEKYPTLDIASDEFSIVAAGAIDILEQHIHIANYWIGWIKALEKTYSSRDSIPSEAECPLTDTQLIDEDIYMVTADIPIKGTVGILKISNTGIVELFVPLTAHEGVKFRLRTDQVSKVSGDRTYTRVMINDRLITRSKELRESMEFLGLIATIIHHP